MDILIKNMKLPKCCYETDGQVVKPCDFLEVCRRKWGVNINALDIHSEACPLVALPEHGDLIDIDLAIEDFAEKHCRYGACNGKACKDCDYYYVIEFFKTSIRKVVEATECINF